jgi:hypothetical protein
MARFDSPGDALLVCVAYYEQTKKRGQNFTQWLWEHTKPLLAGGYVADESVSGESDISRMLRGGPSSTAQRLYHLTPKGEEMLHAILVGDDQNPVHIPGIDFADEKQMMEDIRDRRKRGTKVFSVM